MTRTSISTANGDVSAYGFACGYKQSVDVGGKTVTIYQEHGVYNVRVYDYEHGKRVSWDQFTSIAPARKRYKQLIKECA